MTLSKVQRAVLEKMAQEHTLTHIEWGSGRAYLDTVTVGTRTVYSLKSNGLIKLKKRDRYILEYGIAQAGRDVLAAVKEKEEK
jgi:hypothetical protein